MRAAVCLVILLAVSASIADTPPSEHDYALARSLFQRGQQHFRLAEYQPALADFAEAYRLVPQPALLYNIAQCHRELGQLEDALRFYRSYLSTTRANDPERPAIDARIAELERLLAERQRANQLALERDLERARAERIAAETARGIRPPGRRATARALKWSGAGALALGGALLVGGLGAALAADAARDDLEAAAARRAEFDPSLERSLDARNVATAVTLSIGGALSLAGAGLLAFGISHERRWRAYEGR